MLDIEQLFAKNRAWVQKTQAQDPTFFERLEDHQEPRYLWIGCSDSRVPPSEVVDVVPGDLFVHRNVANVVHHTDFNILSVLQYAVEVLRVKHIIVCGHYGCGGIAAAMQDKHLGLIDNWLRHVQRVEHIHRDDLARLPDKTERLNRLAELNVIEQVTNVCETTVVREAWERGDTPWVHGWIYQLHDGLLHDLQVSANSADLLAERYEETTGHKWGYR